MRRRDYGGEGYEEESFEESKERYERQLARTEGKFLIFDSERHPGEVEIVDNLLDAKEVLRFGRWRPVHELERGYSPWDFEAGLFGRDELNRDDDFFWTPSNHPTVEI